MRFEIPGCSDLNWAIVKEEEVEIWGQNISSHPWKKREYPAKKLEVIKIKEFEIRRAKWQAFEDAKASITNEKKAKKAILQNWVKTLPNTLDGLIIDKKQEEVCDEKGNYLFSLPFEPVENFEDWLKNEINDYFQFLE